MTPEQRARRACTPAAVAATRPEWLGDDERWDPFFPEPKPGHAVRWVYDVGAGICGSCPVDVKAACLSIGQDEPHGMFGGLTPRQRGSHYKRGGAFATTFPDRVEAAAVALNGEFSTLDAVMAAGGTNDDHTPEARARVRRLVEAGVLSCRIDDLGRYLFRRVAA